jgi:hypothetical protein
MFIQIQTKLTEPITIYDSTAPVSEPSGFMSWLQPVVQVKLSDGSILYKTGDFYTPSSIGKYAFLGVTGIMAALITLGIFLKVKKA